MNSVFLLLLVCEGNICRSPFAQQLFFRNFGDVEEFHVESAGTRALVGVEMDPHSQEIARKHEIEHPGMHRGAQLTKYHLEEADLVLAVSRDIRRQIAVLHPPTTRKVFTLREFALLIRNTTDKDIIDEMNSADFAAAAAAGKLRAAVKAAALNRSEINPPTSVQEYDVIDPYGKDGSAFLQAEEQIVPAVQAISCFFRRALAVVK